MLVVFVWLERCCLNRDEIPPGTLYLLILKTLALHGELHGYEISSAVSTVLRVQGFPVGATSVAEHCGYGDLQ